jgi:hypothetical protein
VYRTYLSTTVNADDLGLLVTVTPKLTVCAIGNVGAVFLRPKLPDVLWSRIAVWESWHQKSKSDVLRNLSKN